MELSNFTYIILLIVVSIFPAFYIYTNRALIFNKLRYAGPAILITAFIFLLWDIKFTEVGIWSFSSDYTLGIFHKGLPIEEWLFFFIFPLTSFCAYDLLKMKKPALDYNNVFTAVSLLLIVLFAFVAYKYRTAYYTFFCFLFTVVYFTYIIFRKQLKPHLTHFFFSYLIMLVPYFIISQILTWTTSVQYLQAQTLNIWIGLMPIENFVYLFFMMLLTISVYEYLLEKRFF